MIHIVLCDDSTEFRRVFGGALRKLCREIFPKTLSYEIGICLGSGEEVLRYTEKSEIDVLFLDIDMPGMSGLELAKRLVKKFPEMIIIFVSGYNHFVYDVFEFHPFAFLRKDAILDELPKMLKRLADRLDAESKRITLQTVDGEKTVDARDVLYISSNRNYYNVYTISEKVYSCRGTLKEAGELFSPFDFFQIHSAYIINLDAVSQLDKDIVYIGEENIKIPIAQRRFADFRRAYAAFTLRGIS